MTTSRIRQKNWAMSKTLLIGKFTVCLVQFLTYLFGRYQKSHLHTDLQLAPVPHGGFGPSSPVRVEGGRTMRRRGERAGSGAGMTAAIGGIVLACAVLGGVRRRSRAPAIELTGVIGNDAGPSSRCSKHVLGDVRAASARTDVLRLLPLREWPGGRVRMPCLACRHTPTTP